MKVHLWRYEMTVTLRKRPSDAVLLLQEMRDTLVEDATRRGEPWADAYEYSFDPVSGMNTYRFVR